MGTSSKALLYTRPLCLLGLAVCLLSCTSVRPVFKIGLLAPFEGLHRRSGYSALAAMRQAIAETAPPTVAIMPLALDAGADPDQGERAARKLLLDPDVRALIGPYDPALAARLEPLLRASALPWWSPLAVPPGGNAEPLLTAAADYARTLGAHRLVLVGGTPAWPILPTDQLAHPFTLPLLLSDQVTVVEPSDAVLWLGSPELGADYLSRLRTYQPTVPLLLGPQADDPVFAEHTQISGPVYLLFWQDDHYAQWREQHREQPPTAYLVYRATQQAIAQLAGPAAPQQSTWRLATVPIAEGATP